MPDRPRARLCGGRGAADGQKTARLFPLAQFYLPAPPCVPQVLDVVKLLAVFISQDLIGKFDEETDGLFISRLALATA